MSQLPIDTSVEATYADGFILSETTCNDISPYTGVDNILNDILEKRPETIHGKLERFSVFYQDQRYDIDFTTLPDNARPIRFRHGYATLDNAGNEERGWSGIEFGYQYTENGKNIKEIRSL